MSSSTKIIVGWNSANVNVACVCASKQSMMDINRHKVITNGHSWAISGDFNVTLNPNEHSSGSSFVTNDMMEFKECINQVEVKDLSSAGLHFTWTKNLHKVKIGDYFGILKKLDMIMVNEDFMSKYPQAHAIFMPYLISDHSPALLIIPNEMRFKRKSFNHGNLIEKVKGLKDDLKSIQSAIDADPHNKCLREKGSAILERYLEAVKDKEKLLFQKCKIKWLSYGDKNNSFSIRCSKKEVKGTEFKSFMNLMVKGMREIRWPPNLSITLRIFLGANFPVSPISEYEDAFTTKLSSNEASKVKPITDSEIKKAMFSIGDNKAPGPDGYPAKFFKEAWHIVGTDVCNAVKEFFSSAKLLGELNTNIISLILKISTPLLVTDFRPIACCNMIYKCISKVITERIKGCLDKLINKNQSAFIPGRLIQDNILLAQDLMHGYNRSGGPKRVAFKIDIQKAYDTVSWDFMRNLLKLFGFHEKMVNWIMLCIKTVKFSININGESCGFFNGGRGLRQGDPMSPYLFTMVMEFFTLVIEKNVRNTPEFNYYFGCKSLKITYICFADDLMVFCHGDPCSVKVIKKSIEDFGNCSSLLLNFGKRTVFFGSVNEDEQHILLSILPFVKGNIPMKYLGVPLISKRLGVKDCKSLIDKVNAKTVIKDINIILKNFLWSQSGDSKGQAKVAWKVVCKPKSEGGLGLKDLMRCNKTLLVKHIWNIACNREDTYMWYDNWSVMGSLIDIITHMDLYNARLNKDSCVAKMIVNGTWRNASDWMGSLSSLSTIAVPNITQGYKDKVIWLDNNGIPKKFSMKTVYDDIRDHIQEKLLTHDRLKKWGCYDMMACGLYMRCEESHDHLFFQCEYSKALWSMLQIKMACLIDAYSWKDIVGILADKPCLNNIWSIIRRLSLVKTRLMGLKVKKSTAMDNAAAIWETFNGLASNILESFGHDCTHLVVFQSYLAVGGSWIEMMKNRRSSPRRCTIRKGFPLVIKVLEDNVYFLIGDGASISLWFDKWCTLSPLSNIITRRDWYRAGLSSSSKVRDVICNDAWSWPMYLLDKYPMLTTITLPNMEVNALDQLEWHTELVIIAKRLKTQDKVARWDMSDSLLTVCPLCELVLDSHEHLFFECSFSQQIWNHMKSYAGLSSSTPILSHIMAIITPIANRKSSRSIIAKLVMAASAYFIWQERNARLFKNSKRSVNQVIEVIFSSVRLKLLSCRFKKSKDGVYFAQLWSLPATCIGR
ncbi:RNA-directed DNA polymerase, eukaryota, reverse transcriptase zinc-binding domain protein [Tanacetum coccineum]